MPVAKTLVYRTNCQRPQVRLKFSLSMSRGGDVNEIADDHCISVRVVLALRDLFPGDVLGLDGKPPPMYFRFDGGELQAV